MVNCRPPEDTWIRQQPWKPLALGALASIPAYLAMRALKYSPLASLATSALTFSAVTLTTGLLGKTKIEIHTPPPPTWTDRVKANLERQGMPQEVLDLVTENPDRDALARAISPQIARAADGSPSRQEWEVWVDDQRFPACTARDYSQVLFTEDQLANLTAEIIRTAIDGLHQEKVEVDGQTLYLEPGVTLPAGNPTLVDPRWKTQLKERVIPELHDLIDQQQGTLDDLSVRKTLSAAIHQAYYPQESKEVYVVVNGQLYVGSNRALDFFAEPDYVYPKDFLLNGFSQPAMERAQAAPSLSIGQQTIHLSVTHLQAIFKQIQGNSLKPDHFRAGMQYDPVTKTVTFGTLFAGQAFDVDHVSIHTEIDTLPQGLQEKARERLELRQRIGALGIEMNTQLEKLLRDPRDLDEISGRLSEAIFRAYRKLKPEQPVGEIAASLKVGEYKWSGMEKAEDCIPYWAKRELLALTKETLDHPPSIEVTTEGFGNSKTRFYLREASVLLLLDTIGFKKHPEISQSLKIEKRETKQGTEYCISSQEWSFPKPEKDLTPLDIQDHQE